MFKHKKMRNQELMHDFKQHLAHAFEQGDYRTREELINKTLQSCRPKYDVSFDYALRMMYVMIRDGKPCPARRKNKQEMWKEIRAHVVRTQKRRNCTIAEAVASVLAEQKASRYFLSYKQASKVIYHEAHVRRNHRA